MSSSLNLTLPESPTPRRRRSILPLLNLAVGVAVLVLLATQLRRGGGNPAMGEARDEAARLKELAEDLERRTLYTQADEVWGEYSEMARLSPEEIAEVVYRRGKCLKLGGQYAEAARRLTEVETLPLSRDRKRNAHQLLLECLAALGKQDARENVSKLFATDGAEESGQVLARVADGAITKEEIRAELLERVRRMPGLLGAALTPREREESAAAWVDEQMKDPEQVEALVQQAVSRELLYLEGLERGFGESTRTMNDLARVRKELIAGRVVEEELDRALANLGPTELSNHYEAHKESFVEKAGAEFSYAKFATEEEAAAALVKEGTEAGILELTKASGVARAGEPVPGIGPSAEIAAHLLALTEGEISDRPIEHDGSFYVFRVERTVPERQLSLQEAEPQVRADLAAVKQREVQESLQKALLSKYHVDVLPAEAPPESADDEPEKPDPNEES